MQAVELLGREGKGSALSHLDTDLGGQWDSHPPPWVLSAKTLVDWFAAQPSSNLWLYAQASRSLEAFLSTPAKHKVTLAELGPSSY